MQNCSYGHNCNSHGALWFNITFITSGFHCYDLTKYGIITYGTLGVLEVVLNYYKYGVFTIPCREDTHAVLWWVNMHLHTFMCTSILTYVGGAHQIFRLSKRSVTTPHSCIIGKVSFIASGNHLTICFQWSKCVSTRLSLVVMICNTKGGLQFKL